MLDYNFYKIICGYYNIIVNNKSLNVRAKLVNDLFAKYKLIENKLMGEKETLIGMKTGNLIKYFPPS